MAVAAVVVEAALDSAVVSLLPDFSAFAVLAGLDSVVVVVAAIPVSVVYALLPSLSAKSDGYQQSKYLKSVPIRWYVKEGRNK